MTPLEHPMRKRKIGRSIGPSSHMHDWRRLMGTRSLIFLLIHSNEIAPVLPIAMKLTSLLTAFEPYYGFSRFTGASMPAKRSSCTRQAVDHRDAPAGRREDANSSSYERRNKKILAGTFLRFFYFSSFCNFLFF